VHSAARQGGVGIGYPPLLDRSNYRTWRKPSLNALSTGQRHPHPPTVGQIETVLPDSDPRHVVVADGRVKRIVIVARDSRNAFLVTDPTPVPLLGPAALGLLAVAMGAIPALAGRRRR
jgi:hypothetical protein